MEHLYISLLVHKDKLESFFWQPLALDDRRSEVEQGIKNYIYGTMVDNYPKIIVHVIFTINWALIRQSYFILAHSAHCLSRYDVHPYLFRILHIVDAHGSHLISCKDRGTLPRTQKLIASRLRSTYMIYFTWLVMHIACLLL